MAAVLAFRWGITGVLVEPPAGDNTRVTRMSEPVASRPARVGHYELLEPLGSGGMGTVYRARDTRLQRDVAVKLLRTDPGGDPRQAERLLAEARAAGRLSHPNILSIHEAGTENGQPYLVGELVDGVSLRTLLNRGPLPMEHAIDLATQVADGLTAAHRANLVHRDLKPENVMVTRSGQAKIVDFGLAKSLDPPDGERPPGETLTAPHLIVGTAAYMSPEQARGTPVDYRSDQFSFGVLLYEMLTGRRVFARPSTVETLAAILKDEPPSIADANPHVPLTLQWIVERCLAKQPDGRYAATADLLHDLRAARERTRALPAPAPSRERRGWMPAAAAAGLVLVGIGGIAASWGRATPPVAELPRWQRLTYEQGFVGAARFAPDGQTILYSAEWNNRPSAVFTTTATSPESRALDLPPAGILAVSPSGELALSLGCEFDPATGTCIGTLARAPMLGGAPREVAAQVSSADWGPDGALAMVRSTGVRSPVEYPAGTVVSQLGRGHVRVSPDGLRVAWSEVVDASVRSVMVRDNTGTRTLTSGWEFISGLAWSRAGDAVFVSGVGPGVRDDAVMRVTLDGAITVAARGFPRIRVLDAGPDDRLLVGWDVTSVRLQVWTPKDVRPRDLTWLGDSVLDAASADGRLLLFTVRSNAIADFPERPLFPIYVRSAEGGPVTRIGSGYGVALSPDGRWALTRTRPRQGPSDLALVPIGPGEARTLERGNVDVGEGTSRATFAGPDRLVMRARTGTEPWRTYVQRLDGGPPVVVAHEPGVIVSPISPDDERFVAHRADGSHWVSPVSPGRGPAVPVQVPTDASILQWTEDGRGLVIWRLAGLRGRLSRLDIATGRETPIREIAVTADAGFFWLRGVTASRGGSTVMGSETRVIGGLYLVSGAR